MKKELMKHLEKVILFSLSLFILIGLFLNYEFKNNIKNEENEIIVTNEEKKYLEKVVGGEQNRTKLEEKYLKDLKKLESERYYTRKEYDLGRIYYCLGYNAYLDNNKTKATEYLKKSMEIMENTKGYFYIVKGNNILMNLANVRADNLESINRANKIYQMLQIIDVKSLSDDEQKVIKVSMLNGLIHISSNLGMMNMARTYYDELVDITTDKKFETNISIYARYIYNFNIENYEKAEKIAYEYIKYHENMEEPDDNLINGGYIYLLEVSVALGDFEIMEYAKDKFLKAKMKEPKERFIGVLKKIEGLAYEKKGDYAMALKKYNEAIETFEKVKNYENLIVINNKIINIASEISIDIEPYVQNLQRYDKSYNKDKRLVEVADSIIKISHQKNNKAKKDLKNELDKNAKLIDFSRKINLIYSAIIICFICITIKVKNEITKRKEREVELEMMVKVDHMTKAYSKEFIFEKTNDYIKLGEKFTFIILDLDHFKIVNEKYGYTLGDEILIEFANITKKLIGDNGCLGKFVGDEFIVLLDGKIEHSKFIDIVQETIAKTRYSKANVELTVSGGAIRWDNHNLDEIIYEANVLLYKAKKEGGNRILVR